MTALDRDRSAFEHCNAWPGLAARLHVAVVVGRVTDAVGTVLRVTGLGGRVGDGCRLRDPDSGVERRGEIVGFSGPHALVTPFGTLDGLSKATEVLQDGAPQRVAVGDALLGRVLDGFGSPIDGGPPLEGVQWRSVQASAPDPLRRRPIRRILATGVRAIDGLLALGEGQRIGLFSAAGVGKSTLLSMLARNAQVDVIVAALVGERGREVRDFVEGTLGPDGSRRAVLVVATADKPAMERVKCPEVATTVAEHFRSQGRRVLLLVDSLTRYARARREIGLAAGEPPARRGYPPSFFAALPRLLERAGCDACGSITGIYTVLTEGDEASDPVAEEARSILDGHVVLSERIAAQGRFPAIDVLHSRSRLMQSVVSEVHLQAARKAVSLLAKHEEIEVLIQMGEFRRGQDAQADLAADRIGALRSFMAQASHESSPLDMTLEQVHRLVADEGSS